MKRCTATSWEDPRNTTRPNRFSPMFSSTRSHVPLLLMTAAMIAASNASPPADVVEPQTWRAQLIDGTMQGSCSQYLRDCQSGTGHCLVPDFSVIHRSDEFGAYPPVLFWGKTLLGGASVSTAGCASALHAASCALSFPPSLAPWTVSSNSKQVRERLDVGRHARVVLLHSIGAHGSCVTTRRYAYGWTWTGTCLMRQSLVTSTPCTCTTNLQPAEGSSFNLHLSCSFSGDVTVTTQTCLGTYNYTRVSTYEAPVRADRIQSVSFAIDSEDRKANKASVSVTLGFTAANTIPSGGTLTLNYPSGFFATSVIPFIEPGASSVDQFMAWCGETTSSSLIITTHGAAISAPAFTVTIQGFTMGSATAGADISLQSSSDINASAPVASGQIFGQVLNVTFDISRYDRIAGKSSVTVTLGFVPASPIPPGGTVTVTYPHLFFDLSSRPVEVTGKDEVNNLTLSFSPVTTTFFVITTFGATISASPLLLFISGMTMGAASAGAQSVTVRTSMDNLSSAAVSSGHILASISAPGLASSRYISASKNAPLLWSPRSALHHGVGNDTMVASVRFSSSSSVSSSMSNPGYVNIDVYVDIKMANSGLLKMSIHYFRISMSLPLSAFLPFQGYLITTKSFQVAWSPANDKVVIYLETSATRWSITADSDLNVARVWDIAKVHRLCTIPRPQNFFHPSMWSPDGSMIVSGTVVYHSNTGNPMFSLSGSTVTSVAWFRDGMKLLSGHSDGFVRIHDVNTKSLVMIFTGHNSAVNSIAWSPDATKFATGSADRTVRIWSNERNTSLFICAGHNASISEVWWQDDATVTGGASDNLQLTWLLHPE